MAENTNNFSKRFWAILPLLVIGFLAMFTFFLSTALAGGISPEEVIKYVNRARTDSGLSPVTENTLLSRAAEAKARDMIKENYFSHTSPDGKTPWSWLKEVGYRYKTAGENLAINYSTAKEQHNAWMKSATHRANIMNNKYTEIGVAVVEGKIDGESSLVTVQFFGTPLAAVANKPKPAPVTEDSVTSPVPAIQGEEIVIPSEVIEPVPLMEESTPQTGTPVTPNIPSERLAQALEMSTLITTIVVAFALILSPLAFLARAVCTLWSSIRTKKEVEEAGRGVSIEVKMVDPPKN